MEIKQYDHGTPKAGFIDRIMPFLAGGSLILMSAVIFKMVGAWPVSPSHREMVDSMIEEYPFLDDSVYQSLRFNSGYFSEKDRDMILNYWVMKLQAQQKREVEE